MKMSSKIFTWNFHLKINIFRFSIFFRFFLKIMFLHDEIIFFVRIPFCDQVCVSSNLRNHLEHLPFPHDDSESPTRSQRVGENWLNSPDSAFVFMCTPRKCRLFLSKSGAACLQMDLSRSSRRVE